MKSKTTKQSAVSADLTYYRVDLSDGRIFKATEKSADHLSVTLANGDCFKTIIEATAKATEIKERHAAKSGPSATPSKEDSVMKAKTTEVKPVAKKAAAKPVVKPVELKAKNANAKVTLRVCPVCKKTYSDFPATSRKDNKTAICPDCGVAEALSDFGKHVAAEAKKGQALKPAVATKAEKVSAKPAVAPEAKPAKVARPAGTSLGSQLLTAVSDMVAAAVLLDKKLSKKDARILVVKALLIRTTQDAVVATALKGAR